MKLFSYIAAAATAVLLLLAPAANAQSSTAAPDATTAAAAADASTAEMNFFSGIMQSSVGVLVCLLAEMDLDLVALVLTKQRYFVRLWERMI